MSERSENSTADLLSNVIETIAENVPKEKLVQLATAAAGSGDGSMQDQLNKFLGRQKSSGENSVAAQLTKRFSRQNTVHKTLGGGKPADVLLWRDKKTTSSVLGVATAIWVFFEWLDYHLLTIVCFLLVLAMVVLFAWTNAASVLTRSPPQVPRLRIPEEIFTNVAVAAGRQVNVFLAYLQDVACKGEVKRFLMVVLSLWAAAVIGSWCNFLTVIYIGFIAVHTLPVLYERYQDQVDEFLYNMLELVREQYRKMDTSLRSKVPKGNAADSSKKSE